MPDEKLERYMSAIAEVFGDGQKQVQEALSLIKRNCPAGVDDQPRRLLALRRYLRMGGKKVAAQWTWTPEEAAQKMQGPRAQELLRLAEGVEIRFAEQNPGYTLVLSPLRSLERQVTKWHENASVRVAGNKLHADMLKELEDSSYPSTPDPQSYARFRNKLQFAKVQPEPTSAAPGTSDHGQFAAVDFVIQKGSKAIATTLTTQIATVWKQQGWEAKLIKAVNQTLKGPLPNPYEPWHWEIP